MPRPDPDARKQEIIAAAASVFSRKGFYSSSMDDIVQESGLSKGGLYWHFKSKDAIIMAVLDQFFSEELSEIESLLTAPPPVAPKLEQILLQMMVDTETQLQVYRNIWLEFYAVAAREGEFRQRMLAYMAEMIALFDQLIARGIQSGEFRAIDSRAVAVTTVAQLEGLILLWAIDPDSIDLQPLTKTAVAILLTGLTVTTEA